MATWSGPHSNFSLSILYFHGIYIGPGLRTIHEASLKNSGFSSGRLVDPILNNFGGWVYYFDLHMFSRELVCTRELVISHNSFQVSFACAPGIVVLFHFVRFLPHFFRYETQAFPERNIYKVGMLPHQQALWNDLYHNAPLWNCGKFVANILPSLHCGLTVCVHFLSKKVILTDFPQCNFGLEIPQLLSQNHLLLSLTGNALGFFMWWIVGYSLKCPIVKSL